MPVSLYLYVYVERHVYVYVYTCTYVYVYTRTYVCMHACMHVCICVCVCEMLMHICRHVCVCRSMGVRISSRRTANKQRSLETERPTRTTGPVSLEDLAKALSWLAERRRPPEKEHLLKILRLRVTFEATVRRSNPKEPFFLVEHDRS